jgi:adenylate kinase
VVLMGPPGSGKSTVLEELEIGDGAAVVEIGALLREEVAPRTRRGDEVRPYLDDGLLAPTELVDTVVDQAIADAPDRDLIFDGYPRNRDEVGHLRSLEEKGLFDEAIVVALHLTRESAVRRVAGRRSCRACGLVTNIQIRPPQQRGICDACGGELVHREDDHEDAVVKRVDAYEAEGLPALEELHALRPGAVIDISAEGPIAEVRAEVAAALEARGVHLQRG